MSSVLASLPSLGAGATGAGAGTAPGGAGATGGATSLQILGAGFGIAAGLGAIASGFVEKAQLQTQAFQFDVLESQELAAGAERARGVAEEGRKVLGAQLAVFAASGIDVSVGTPVNVGEAARAETDRRKDITRKNARRRANRARLQARALRAQSKTSVARGFVRAAGIGVSTISAF